MLDVTTKEEMLDDLYFFSKRLSNSNSKRNKDMFSKLMREGGHIEFTLPIFASKEVIDIVGLNTLEDMTKKNSYHTIRKRILEKAPGLLHWEHRTEVLECENACIKKAKILSKEDFKMWARDQIKNHWSICIVTKEQEVNLRNLNSKKEEKEKIKGQKKEKEKIKGPLRYESCKIEIVMIRESLF